MKAIQRCLLVAAAIWIIHMTIVVDSTSAPISKELTLTLTAGKNTAYLNGELYDLQIKPYIDNGIFYLPMQEIVTMMGGNYREKNNVIEIEFPTYKAKYTIGKRSYMVNGIKIQADAPILHFGGTAKRATYIESTNQTLLRRNGSVYFPLGFTGLYAPDRYAVGLNSVVYAGDTKVILSTVQDDYCLIDTESPNTTISTHISFEMLSDNIKTELRKCEDTGNVLNYNIEHYKSDDLNVYVMRLASGEDEENMDDKICRITTQSARFCTPRGLRVGDNKSRINLLYGEWEDPFLELRFEKDCVAEIILRTNYC